MELLVGLLAAWGLIMLVWALLGAVLLPLRRDIPMTVVLHSRGDAFWLEPCARGVMWLRDSGLLWWDVMILDEGMSDEARQRAEQLSQGQMLLMDMDGLKKWMEEKHDRTGTTGAPGYDRGGAVSE